MIPSDNPVMHTSPKTGKAVVKLVFVIREEDRNVTLFGKDQHYEIVDELERRMGALDKNSTPTFMVSRRSRPKLVAK